MALLASIATLACSTAALPLAAVCTNNGDCSLNGLCSTTGVCVCDKPWKGASCESLAYAKTPVSGKDLYPFNNTGAAIVPSTSLNTWNGPIVGPVDGEYHFYNPIYHANSLLSGNGIMHGVSKAIAGPYNWFTHPHIKGGTNPAAVTYVDPADGKTKYTLWQGAVQQSESPNGPWVEVMKRYPGGNPAPVFHKGAWYFTSQSTTEVMTTPTLSMNSTWALWGKVDHANVTSGTRPEDPFMWIDKRDNWHIVNHAYNTGQFTNCGSSTLSTHFFSPDGKTWRSLPGTGTTAQPYGHTVEYEDGTSHTYTTLERPNLHFDATGQLTHINLAADMITGDAGCKGRAAPVPCPARNKNGCACTNCKYADHAGSIIVTLDV